MRQLRDKERTTDSKLSHSARTRASSMMQDVHEAVGIQTPSGHSNRVDTSMRRGRSSISDHPNVEELPQNQTQ